MSGAVNNNGGVASAGFVTPPPSGDGITPEVLATLQEQARTGQVTHATPAQLDEIRNLLDAIAARLPGDPTVVGTLDFFTSLNA